MRHMMMRLAALCVAMLLAGGCVEAPSGSSVDSSSPDMNESDMTFDSGQDLGVQAEEDLGEVPEEDMGELGTDLGSDMTSDEDMSTPSGEDMSLPQAVCGNGSKEPGESCDHGVANDVLCEAPYGGSCTFCDSSCNLVKVLGGTCGDGVQQRTEECEGDTHCTACTCDDGFVPFGGSCVDQNECDLENPCDPNAVCLNTEGGFTCECKTGWSGDGFTCEDVPECAGNPCGEGLLCQESQGSYRCVDKNECVNTSACPHGTACVNMDMTSQGQPFRCENLNECDLGVVSCNPGTTCVDKNPMNGEARYSCEDVDECAGANACDVNATCTNLVGSYQCDCNEGYVGDGQTCREVEVCGDGLVEGSEVCDTGIQVGVTCTPGYDSQCTWCASDCRSVELEVGGTCGDGVVQGPEQCDDGASNTDQLACEPWETCPAHCTTSCQQKSSRAPTCQQYQGDVTLMVIPGNANTPQGYGRARWVAGDYKCYQVWEPWLDMTSFCSVSGNVYIRTGGSMNTPYIDSNGNSRHCEETQFHLQAIHSVALPLQHIGGDLVFEGPEHANSSTSNQIDTLTGLDNLRVIEGSLRTPGSGSGQARPDLMDTSALANLEYVGGDLELTRMTVGFCAGAQCAFDSLAYVAGSVDFYDIQMLTPDLDIMPALQTVGGSVALYMNHVDASNNRIAGDLYGWNALQQVGGFLKLKFTSFDRVLGFGALTSVGGFEFYYNPFLSLTEQQNMCAQDPTAPCQTHVP